MRKGMSKWHDALNVARPLAIVALRALATVLLRGGSLGAALGAALAALLAFGPADLHRLSKSFCNSLPQQVQEASFSLTPAGS